MKKFALFVLFTSILKISSAQLTKNNWLVGGALAYKRHDTKNSDDVSQKGSRLEAALNCGYFLTDKLAAGVQADAYFGRDKYPQQDGTTTILSQRTIGLGPFVRYYFLPVDQRVNVFSYADFSYAVHNSKTTDRIKEISKAWSSSLGAGAVIFLNTSVGLKFLAAYRLYREIDVDYRDNQLQFKIGLQFHLERED